MTVFPDSKILQEVCSLQLEVSNLRAQLVAAEEARLNDINAMGMMEVRARAAEALASAEALARLYQAMLDGCLASGESWKLRSEQAEVKLASAKKALEEIYTEDTRVTDGGKCHDLGACAEIATSALSALTDEKST